MTNTKTKPIESRCQIEIKNCKSIFGIYSSIISSTKYQ